MVEFYQTTTHYLVQKLYHSEIIIIQKKLFRFIKLPLRLISIQNESIQNESYLLTHFWGYLDKVGNIGIMLLYTNHILTFAFYSPL